MKESFKKYLPHIVAFILFTVLSFAYFFPVLEGKVLKANDSIVAKVNMEEIAEYRNETGEEALWTNSIFGGMPAYLISTKYPGNLFSYVNKVLQVYGRPVAFVFLSMLSFYIMLLIFGVNPWLAIVGACAYGFSPYLIQVIAAGHNTKSLALAYAPLVVGGVHYAYQKDLLKGCIIFAVALALEIGANHPQITYYLAISLMVYVIAQFIYSIKEKNIAGFIKKSLVLLIPIILGVCVNFGNLYTTYEYGKYSMRGKSDLVANHENVSEGLDKDYITQWSYGVGETMNLLIPNFKGGSSKPFDSNSETAKALRKNNNASYLSMFQKYWGDQPMTEGPNYLGAIMAFLFVLGIIILKGPEKWWLLIATVLSILLAWGHNFMWFTNIFIDHFLGYNKFRAVTMILTIAQLCVPLMGILALKEFFTGTMTDAEKRKSLFIATGVVGGLTLLFSIIPSLAGSFLNSYESEYPEWLTTALIADRKDLLVSDSLRSLAFILLTAVVLYLSLKKKLNIQNAFILVGVLVFADLWFVDKRYLGSDKFEMASKYEQSFSPTTADNYILQDKSEYRVLNLAVSTFNDNSTTSYFHHSIGGYHGAKMKRYQELIDSAIYKDLSLFSNASQTATTVGDLLPAVEQMSIINMLNTKYIIYNNDAPPIQNTFANGNAWFVDKATLVDNANEEIAKIQVINPKNEAVIDKKFSQLVTRQSFQRDEEDHIEQTSYQPNRLVYKYSANNDQLAVFSEIYYPKGWNCYVDGKETEHFRADYVLRAAVLPAGDHEVVFEFKPKSYYTGNTISLASSLILVLAIAGMIAKKYFGKKDKKEN